MSDLELILLILAGFYLFECAHWARPGALVFLSHFGERHRPHSIYSHALLRNEHGGLLFGNLLPLGDSALCQSWPVSLSPIGVSSYVSLALTPDGRPEQPRRFWRFAEMQKVAVEGRKVLVNGNAFVTVSTAELAARLAELLRKLAALPEVERSAAIDAELAESLNHERVRERYDVLARRSLGLLIACSGMFALLFVAFPFALWFDVPIDFLTGLLLFLALLVLVVLNYSLAARAVWPVGASAGRKAMLCISPADAMHARDSLFRALLTPFHPLAAARVLCAPAVFQDLARHVLLDLRFPLPEAEPTADDNARQAEAWFHDRVASVLVGYLQQAGIDAAGVLAPPVPERSECVAYCPRCRGQYERCEGDCSACTGIALWSFTDPAPVLDVKPSPLAPIQSPVAVSTPAPLPPASRPAAPVAAPSQSRKESRKKRKGKR